ncbi:MAG: DUF1444 family protein [Gaiellaceae bacterium]
MLQRAALLACALLVAVASGCAGDGGGSAEEELPPSSFQEAVVAGLKQAGLEAEAGPELEVSAFEGPNRVDLALDEAFAQYEADPDRKDEIVAGLAADAELRLAAGNSDVSLEEARPDLMPLLQAPFDLRSYGFEPAATEMPGSLSLVYVVDADDAYTVVRPEDVERWGTTVEELEGLALDNLLQQTNEEEELLCEPAGDLELCGWSTSDGYDATRMVVPGLRCQIVREYGGPAVYAVPMNNVFVALPLRLVRRGETGELLRARVQQDFQTSDEPVSPELFVERDGELAVFR